MRVWLLVVLLDGVAWSVGLGSGEALVQRTALVVALLLLLALVYRVLTREAIHGARYVATWRLSWGRPLQEEVVVENTAPVGIGEVALVDHSELPGHKRGGVVDLGWGAPRVTYRTRTPCLHRGRWRLGPMVATYGPPLGLWEVSRAIGGTREVLVEPRIEAVRQPALALAGFQAGEARGQRFGDTPPTFTGLRPYQEGDPLSAICWPAWARGERLVRVFAPEVHTRLWFALDLDEESLDALDGGGTLERDAEDFVVTIASSYAAWALTRADLEVGCVCGGAEARWLACGLGPRHGEHLIELLAVVRRGDAPLDLARIARAASSGTQVVCLITARRPETWGAQVKRLRARRCAVRVVQLVPDGFDGWDAVLRDEAGRTGRAGLASPMSMPRALERRVPAASWGVPTLVLPLWLADPAYGRELARALETGEVAAEPSPAERARRDAAWREHMASA